MRRIRMLVLVAVLAVIAALAGNPPSAAPEKKNITFETIRYDDLGERIKDLQGRVVVVDFWAQYCMPCKREFPRLVDLHRKYAGQGLAAVSSAWMRSTIGCLRTSPVSHRPTEPSPTSCSREAAGVAGEVESDRRAVRLCSTAAGIAEEIPRPGVGYGTSAHRGGALKQ